MSILNVFVFSLFFLSSELSIIQLNHKKLTLSQVLSSGKYFNLKYGGIKDDEHFIKLREFTSASYFGLVSVGTPSQNFTAVYDTGSSDFWIPSKKCKRQELSCIIHKKYNSNKSLTYSSLNKTFSLQYGTGSVSGELGTDIVKISDFKIKTQVFGEATMMSKHPFIQTKFDGILGLGFKSLSSFGATPVFENIFKQFPYLNEYFAIYLNSNISSTFGGEISIASKNNIRFTGNLKKIPLVHTKYWTFKVNNIEAGEITVCNKSCIALLDSGTSLIAGPTSEVRKINLKLGFTKFKYGIYSIECSRVKELESVIFNIAGSEYIFKNVEYVLKFGTICISSFFEFDISEKSGLSWILGDTFMRKYYSVFDAANQHISLATSVPSI